MKIVFLFILSAVSLGCLAMQQHPVAISDHTQWLRKWIIWAVLIHTNGHYILFCSVHFSVLFICWHCLQMFTMLSHVNIHTWIIAYFRSRSFALALCHSHILFIVTVSFHSFDCFHSSPILYSTSFGCDEENIHINYSFSNLFSRSKFPALFIHNMLTK